MKLSKPNNKINLLSDFLSTNSEQTAWAIRNHIQDDVLDRDASRKLVTGKIPEGERVFAQKAMFATISNHQFYTPEDLAEFSASSTSPYRKYSSCRTLQAPLSMENTLSALRLCDTNPKDVWPEVTGKQAIVTAITRSLARFIEINHIPLDIEAKELAPIRIQVGFTLAAILNSPHLIGLLQRDWSAVSDPLDNTVLNDAAVRANFAMTEGHPKLSRCLDLIGPDNIASVMSLASAIAWPFFLCQETIPAERLIEAGMFCAGIFDQFWVFDSDAPATYYWSRATG